MKWQLGGKCALTGSGKPARSGPAAPAATTIEVTTATTKATTTAAAAVPAALNTQDENQVARALKAALK